jgi:broad specificity phosphatase PhoE
MTRVFLVRHGEVEEPYKGVFAGRTDIGLSPIGEKQALVTAKFLSEQNIHAVYASPMKRVKLTLEPFIKLTSLKPVFLDELVEIDFGAWTGYSFAEVEQHFGVNAYTWLDQIDNGRIPKAETTEDLVRRVKPAIDRIITKHKGENIAIFCHGGIIRVIISILVDIPLVKLGKIGIDYCSVNKVEINDNGASLRLLNFLPWKNGKLPIYANQN